MFSKLSIVVLIAIASIPVTGYAQTPVPHPPSRGRSIIARTAAKRGYLGVGIAEVTPERAKALKLPDDSGVEVKRVDQDSPAAKAGLKENDVILELNNEKIDDIDQFIRAIGESAPGSKANLTVWRNGAKQNLTATLEARAFQYLSLGDGDMVLAMPPMPPMPAMPEFPILAGQSPRIGFEGETLTPQLAEFFGVKEGVLVRTVVERTPAEKAGLKAGDVIVKVMGTPVSSPREISGLVRASQKTATFTVVRNHKEITLNVEISANRVPESEREVL
jgi:serine protease Do